VSGFSVLRKAGVEQAGVVCVVVTVVADQQCVTFDPEAVGTGDAAGDVEQFHRLTRKRDNSQFSGASWASPKSFRSKQAFRPTTGSAGSLRYLPKFSRCRSSQIQSAGDGCLMPAAA